MEYSKQPPQAPGYNNPPMAGYDTQFTAPPQGAPPPYAPPGVQPTVAPSYAPQVAPAGK